MKDRLGTGWKPPWFASLEWTLRIGAFLCFVGHGAFGVMTKEGWVPYFGVVGIGRDMAFRLMPLVGTMDIVMGFLILIRPRPVVAYWMVGWAVWTALLRPLSGDSLWEAVERAGNYGVPAALVVLMQSPRSVRDLFAAARYRVLTPEVLARTRWVLTMTTSMLLLGHGALGVAGKRGLVMNYASLVSADVASAITPRIGWFEIGLAALVLARLWPALLVFVSVWKLATEWLFFTAGAPFWEVVERGGSYAAPIALAIVVVLQRISRPPRESAARARRSPRPSREDRTASPGGGTGTLGSMSARGR
jgi:hypothetical protein